MFVGVKCPVTARTGVPALVRKLVGDELIRSVWTTERARLGVQTGWKSGSYSIAEFPQICDIERSQNMTICDIFDRSIGRIWFYQCAAAKKLLKRL